LIFSQNPAFAIVFFVLNSVVGDFVGGFYVKGKAAKVFQFKKK